MDKGLKPRGNRDVYLATLRRMTPEQRLAKALELTEMTRVALLAGLRKRYSDASPDELQALFVSRIERCRRRSY